MQVSDCWIWLGKNDEDGRPIFRVNVLTYSAGHGVSFSENRAFSAPNKDRLLGELKELGGKVLMTSLSHEDKNRLQAPLSASESADW